MTYRKYIFWIWATQGLEFIWYHPHCVKICDCTLLLRFYQSLHIHLAVTKSQFVLSQLFRTSDDEWQCDCPKHLGGDLCERPIDLCEGNPCHRGATCISLPEQLSFACLCPYGTAGLICNESKCSYDLWPL